MVGLDRMVSALAGGFLLASGALQGGGPGIWLPTIPPLPPLTPAISDTIVFTGSNGTISGSPPTFEFDASCPLWVSYPDVASVLSSTFPEVFTTPGVPDTGSPGCTTFHSSGSVDWAVPCLLGSLDSTASATSIAGPDGSLTNINYNIDVFAGIGLLSGGATENETGESSTSAVLYGVVLLVSSDCSLSAGTGTFTIAGILNVVEDALNSP